MLEKKHLVFLAGATAPSAPPLCTALPLRHILPKAKETNYQLHRSSALWPKINTQRFRNTFMNRLIFNYNLAMSFFHCLFNTIFQISQLFIFYLVYLSHRIFVTFGSFLNSFCNREYVFLFYEIKT